MNFIPFAPEHVLSLDLQERQSLSGVTLSYLQHLRQLGPSASAEADGRVWGSAGIAMLPFGIGTLWAFCDRRAGKYFVSIDRALRRLIDLDPIRRIEASCEVDFAPACRWLELLGFEQEGVLRKYGLDGRDHYRYARVR